MHNKQLLRQLATATLLLLTSPINWAAPVGRVTEQTGPTEIFRNKKSVTSSVDTAVEMQDTVTTAKSRVTLSFEDKTTVKITEQSKLVIDDFVYDPSKGTGKLATVVTIDQANINNMLIISPPPEIKETVYRVDKTALDKNELDVDLLAFKDLDKNSLDDKKEIDRNDLEIDLLSLVETDELAAQNKTALGNAFEKNILPNYNPASNIGYYFNDDKSKITLYRRPDHVAEVTVGTEQNAVVNINQGGTAVKQQINSGGNTVITIIQK